LATIGTEAGRGKIIATDIWPDCLKISAEGEIPEAGLLIPDSLTATHGGSIATVDGDCRFWLGALQRAMLTGATVRSSTTASAITARTNLTTLRQTGVAIPASWYDATNPLTGLTAADLAKIRVTQEIYLIEYEILIDPETQTVGLNIATS
jgi:hypothetical protein